MNSSNEAFELLLESVRRTLDDVQEAGATALRASQIDKAQKALDRARQLQTLVAQTRTLEGEFTRLLPVTESSIGDLPPMPAAHPRGLRGVRTPEAAYHRLILETLAEMGGSGDVNAVLDRVYTRIKHQLNEYDLAPLPSDDMTPRWRNTAQWTRNKLREQGLVRADSPRGVWAISEAGRAWLAKQD